MSAPLARAVYRALIGLLPGGFTRRYGPELDLAFDERIAAAPLAQQRYRARLMVVFAVLAAVVAAMGIYGVTARSVARRTREMAIRMALGAERRTVMTMVLRQGAVIAAIGAVIGIALSIFSTRLLSDLLYDVTAFDPMTLGIIAVLIGLASVLASLGPSRRATRVDPITALRSE